ncbi:inner centromere [Lasius niger]|uniref:Inner centromere n=1 Tax=Lasius niger TaxID=67767 RepID=A0A0J7JYF4_LASNI|nr:inner centromere [Lasius niger]
MEAAREIWRLFLRQYAPVLEFLEESYPEFWAEINDVQETIRGLTTTTRGAVVREFPDTRERETQTEMSQAHGEIYLRPPVRHFGQSVRIVEAGTDRASQADVTPRERDASDSRYRGPERRRTTDRASSPRPQRRRVDRATSPYLPDRAGSTDSRRMDPRQPRQRGTEPVMERLPLGCWNCGGRHRYTACPLPRQRDFCYGCGREGATVRTCPRCGPHYDPEAPSQEERGPGRSDYPERNGRRRDTRHAPYPSWL